MHPHILLLFVFHALSTQVLSSYLPRYRSLNSTVDQFKSPSECLAECMRAGKGHCTQRCIPQRSNQEEEGGPDDHTPTYEKCLAQAKEAEPYKTQFPKIYELLVTTCECYKTPKTAEKCIDSHLATAGCLDVPTVFQGLFDATSRSNKGSSKMPLLSSRPRAGVFEQHSDGSLTNAAEPAVTQCFSPYTISKRTYSTETGLLSVNVLLTSVNIVDCKFIELQNCLIAMSTGEVKGSLGVSGTEFTDCKGYVFMVYGLPCTIVHSTFKNCGSKDFESSCIHIYSLGSVEIGNTEFIGCKGKYGAAITIAILDKGKVSISRCTFKNLETASAPAAISIQFTFEDSDDDDDDDDDDDSDVEAGRRSNPATSTKGTLSITNCAFEGNKADTVNEGEGVDAEITAADGIEVPASSVTLSELYTDAEGGNTISLGDAIKITDKSKLITQDSEPSKKAEVDKPSGYELSPVTSPNDKDDKFPTWAIIVIVVGAVVIIAVVVTIIVVVLMKRKGGPKIAPDDKTFSGSESETSGEAAPSSSENAAGDS